MWRKWVLLHTEERAVYKCLYHARQLEKQTPFQHIALHMLCECTHNIHAFGK